MLYESVIQVDERLQLINNEEERVESDVKGVSGDYIRIVKPLDVEALRKQLQVMNTLSLVYSLSNSTYLTA